MKILFVTPLYEPVWKAGGVVRSLSTLCRAIAKLGIVVTVYTTNSSRKERPLEVPLNTPVNLGGVSVYYFKPTFGPNSIFDSRDLSRKLWQTVNGFDVVYVSAWFMWIGIEAASICHKMHVPMVAGIHGGFSVRSRRKSYIRKKLFRELFIRKALNRAAAVHLTSEVEKRSAGTWLDNLPTLIIPNPVDPEIFYPCRENRDDFRNRYNIPLDASVLISVGRLDRMKRVDLIIGALERAHKWYLVFVGDCSTGKGTELKKHSEKLGVDRRVIWTGFLTGRDLLAALSSADLFALVSESENFGNVVGEAMMCGLPVMISREVGISEFIKDEKFTITSDMSSEAIIDSLMNFEKHKIDSYMSKEYIRQFAINKFSPRVVAKQFIAELQKILPINKMLD